MLSIAQSDSTKAKLNMKWGIDVSYTGMSYTESAVAGFQITWTTKKHALNLGPHIFYHNLFEGQNDWARFGFSLTYQYFPIRSNRLFSPFVFYDLNYNFSKSQRQVILTAEDGLTHYGVARKTITNAFAHHFGIGTRCNFYKGFFLHLSAGAGPGTFGRSIYDRSLHDMYSDTKDAEHPFTNFELALMFRIGIAYQIGSKELSKQAYCCN